MDSRGEVEFLPDDGGPEHGWDVLEPRRRRKLPRWVWLIAAALVVALAVSLTLSHQRSGHPVAVPSRSSSPSPSASISSESGLGSRLPFISNTPALDVVMSGRTTWVLQSGRITVLDDLSSRRAAGSFTADLSHPNSQPVLLLDPAGAALWVVLEGSAPGRVIEFDAFTLRQRRALTLNTIDSAAALGGQLYIASGPRLIDIAPGAAPRVVAIPRTSGLVGVAADPTRGRLLLYDGGDPTHLWTYRPGGTLFATSRPLQFGKGSIAVAAGQIWVGGFGATSAVLLHLRAASNSPDDLTPVDTSPLTGGLGPGALIVASGQHVFWVRSGAGGDDLWCVDAATGHAVQHWNIDGPVASASGASVVAASSGVFALRLGACAG